LLRALFFPQPGADTEALNAGSPAGDVATFGGAVRRTATHVAELSGAADPDEHAATVVAAFLPDQLRYQPGQPARYDPGTGNGRDLHDDAFGTALSLLTGHQLGVTTSPNPPWCPDSRTWRRPGMRTSRRSQTCSDCASTARNSRPADVGRHGAHQAARLLRDRHRQSCPERPQLRPRFSTTQLAAGTGSDSRRQHRAEKLHASAAGTCQQVQRKDYRKLVGPAVRLRAKLVLLTSAADPPCR
jgi:hypothetical protein